LDRGAAVEAKESQGKTPLHLASQNGDKELTSLFLSRGADVHAVDEGGATPLHAVASGRALWTTGGPGSEHKPVLYGEIAELLISKGAKVDASDAIGDTPLHLAGVFCDLEVAKVLLTHKADLRARTAHGETPLKAAERGLQDWKSMAGRLPQAEVAERNKCYDEVIRLLREKGAE
jgi:ankyrin repeat protein